jgi:hypothetical protein
MKAVTAAQKGEKYIPSLGNAKNTISSVTTSGNPRKSATNPPAIIEINQFP